MIFPKDETRYWDGAMLEIFELGELVQSGLHQRQDLPSRVRLRVERLYQRQGLPDERVWYSVSASASASALALVTLD